MSAVNPADLARIADLIKLGAETAKLFSDTKPGNGRLSRISELALQIERAADELAEIGNGKTLKLEEDV